MARRALVLGLMGLGLVACGEESSAGSNPFGTGSDPATMGDGLPSQPTTPTGDGNGGPMQGGDGEVPGNNGGGSDPFEIEQSGPDGGMSTPSDAGLVLPEEVSRVVQCGNDPCEISDGYVCCESWRNTGWDNVACAPEAACDNVEPGFPGPTAWDLTSTCDGREDCGLGQVCCFVSQGMPGAGFGRQCMGLTQCNGGGGLTMGMPQGIYSCNDDGLGELGQPGSDCPRDGQTCVMEADGAESAGGQAGRPYVGICQ